MNVLDPIFFHCRHDPDALAFCVPGVDVITYGRLEMVINNVARAALAAGLKPGNKVALFIPNRPAFHAALLLGLARIGVVTASIGSPNLAKALRFDAVLSENPQPSPGAGATIRADVSWVEGDGKPPVINHVPQGSDVCRIVLTSGTTGEPKGIALTHDMILGRILRYYAVFGGRISSCRRYFCDTTLATSIGNMFFLYTLCKGGAFFTRGNSVENTLHAFGIYRVEGLIASPAGLDEFAGYYDQYRCQHTFDAIMTIGSMLSPLLAARVQAHMGPNLVAAYGSTEVGIVASAPAHFLEKIAGAVGYIAPGMAVEIVDESGRLRAANAEGIVRISGDFVADKYIGNTGDSGQFFRDGWFYPGDVGRLAEDRLLVISGRQKHILNVGGEKVKPEIIEEVLALAGVTAGVFLVTSALGVDEIWSAVESSGSLDEDRLRQHCQKSLPWIFVPKRFVALQKLPRNDTGKLDRPRLAEVAGAR